jgi:UDP-N-acetylmuramoyl-L-alanyl-D-glutamate--2,6-diaminopimelate ligase
VGVEHLHHGGMAVVHGGHVAGEVAAVEVEPDRATAITRAIESARDGDVVLIAGKGAEQGQEFADRTIPFDDREAAREALRTLGART